MPALSSDAEARDWRVGLLPQVVQPGLSAALAGTGAAASSESAAAAMESAAAARVRAVFTGLAATAATIAGCPDRRSAAR